MASVIEEIPAMSDPVEVIARSLSALRVHQNMRIEKRKLTPEAFQESVDYGWRHFTEEAHAALESLEEMGYVIVLRGEIEEAMQDALERGRAYHD
jgi:hypothetical protein